MLECWSIRQTLFYINLIHLPLFWSLMAQMCFPSVSFVRKINERKNSTGIKYISYIARALSHGFNCNEPQLFPRHRILVGYSESEKIAVF